MKRTIAVLSVIFVVQIGLFLGLTFSGSDLEAFQPKEKLLALSVETIDKVTIDGEDGDSVTLEKKDGEWVLPDIGNFPVDADRADRLLKKLAGLQKGWPVATTESATKRFKVEDSAFVRKITFYGEGVVKGTLYIGTAPSYRYVHVRADGDDKVYNASFSSYEAGAQSKDWETKDFLNLKLAEIAKVDFPSFTLVKNDDGEVSLIEPKLNEKLDMKKAKEFFDTLAKISYEAVLGVEEKEAYGQANPVLNFTLETKDGNRIGYTVSKLKEEEGFVLRTSTHPFFFKASKWNADKFVEKQRKDLLESDGVTTKPAADNEGKSNS